MAQQFLDDTGLSALWNKIKAWAAPKSHTHSDLPLSGGTLTGDLRLKGSSNYGRKINFGDGEFVYLKETTDDALDIYATKGINLKTNGSTGVVKVNGTKVSVEGHAHSISDILNLQTTLDGKADASHSHSYNDLTDKPTIPDDSGLLHRTGVETISGKKYFNGGIEMGLSIISNMDDPEYAYDAANKHYVDDAVSGKYSKPSNGIPETDLAQTVQTKLNDRGTSVVVDAALDVSSENAIQNKVVKTALDGKQATIADLATIRSNAAAGATASTALNGYKIVVTSSIPSSVASNTIYFITA